MNQEKREQIFKYLQEQIAQSEFRVKAYVLNERNERNPQRNCFVKLNMHLSNFLKGNASVRWLVIPGFRGVGKTTLLAQLYYGVTTPDVYKLFLSVDEVVQILGVRLIDVLQVYEEVLGVAFERLDKPLLLFLDEVHYDPQWAIALKTVYDRSRMVFMVTTGSSALTIQQNPDVARRAFTEKLYPMSFTEYMKVKFGKYEDGGLAFQLRTILYESQDAQEVYRKLQLVDSRVKKYWLDIERLEIDRYMKYGTLPFAVRFQNEGLAYDQIKKIIDRIVGMDVAYLGKFAPEVSARIPEILYIVSSSDVLSITNLAKDIGLSRNTLSDILDILEKTELLIRIYPYGAHGSQVKKPSKYLFASPAFRSMYYYFVGNIISPSTYIGKLFEDTAGLYLRKYVVNKHGSLTYDSTQEGADFILHLINQNIIIEVGYGRNKGIRQIQKSAEKIKAKYGLVISQQPLAMGDDGFSVIVPATHFLLT
jgi:predicted AAA+ superfamily ATPase